MALRSAYPNDAHSFDMHKEPYIEDSYIAAQGQKRKEPPGELEEVSGTRKAKDGGSPLGPGLPHDNLHSAYVLQLQTSLQLSWERTRQETAFDRILLRPEVIDFAAAATEMMMAGKPSQAASGPGAGSMRDFILQKENKALVEDLIRAADLEGSADDFAGFADGNDRLLKSSEVAELKQRAQELKEFGVVELLGEEMPWQCRLIANFDKIVAHLEKAS